MENYKSEIGRVRGLGSAKKGTEQWWMQRLTATLLIPLTLWFCITLFCLIGKDYTAIHACFSSTMHAVLLLIYICILCYHALLGLIVIIEDYVHNSYAKYTSLIFVKAIIIFAAFLSCFSIFKIAFGE